MHYYIYTRPGHPDDGMGYCSPEPIVWGAEAEGDARYYIPTSPPAPPTVEQRMAAVRSERAARLAACDWTQLPDAPLTETARTAWAAYRQALRDVPQQPTAPDVIWPDLPTA